ncbi:T9SS C-terminal target domain-containing protein [Aquimarina sp. AD10]|uniref:leucine-rich repeat domain-containing protein n=1 Tax=Aquimarina sp. AD10 TaxID=1714849 RepID=UPI000E4EC116|nr:T9SS C-terminal target domain-containing protein [Aquimarina sp. AD10]AXT61741.1 T9SS C-terminal target domain-containing protein [Aquimarina sp. AD10]RKN00908.1 T9SS C-terminal target domain-containing protein [Aquimarina sp. AD10]
MKKIIFLGIFLFLSTITYAQIINFTDANFKTALLNHNPVIDTNGDGEITVQEAELVASLRVTGLNISNLDGIEYFTSITRLWAFRNNLTSLDLANNIKLRDLNVSSNKLKNINISTNVELRELNVAVNALTNLNVSNNINLLNINCNFNELISLDVTKNKSIGALKCSINKIKILNLLNNGQLRDLSCSNNELTNLDITKNPNLTQLICSSNRLTTLDLTNNINLSNIICSNNQLTTLALTNTVNPSGLNCSNNQLKTLDISANPNLATLNCDRNQLTNLDFSANTILANLNCSFNTLERLDTRNCSLITINFGNNPNLTTAFLTQQKFLSNPELRLSFQNCPSLNFICIDQEYITPVNNLLTTPGYFSSVNVSTQCAEVLYNISGSIKYDSDNNGCDASDIGFSNLKFVLQSPTGFIETFPNNSGAYNTPIHDNGDYFMFPLFENPTYFNIDPAPSFPPLPISFPKDGPNLIKDFCITPNGIHNDIEVSIIPVSAGTPPGFDSEYSITYKNNGTSIQSGNITLDYMQDVLTLVSSNPTVVSSTSNKLSWSFSNLRPLESRDINIVFNLNKPTDNPALNSGDVLSFEATATAGIDETPNNNIAVFNQTVVNSYDPNDKICLEGDTIEPKDVGSYLHYMIRFENKGTANAINIRIEDVIDVTKLDIESFIPLQASHPYTTLVKDKKEIEFIFSNINLPFDDANNDGYVLFKIRTKDNLVEGDTIDNTAAIFFDFNFPIITDVETVTVKKKVVAEPSFTDYFTLSPNPTKGNLTLTPKGNTDINIQFILIMDIGGNPVGYFPGTLRNFNVSYLFANNYFMQLHTDKGLLSTQFIKIN